MGATIKPNKTNEEGLILSSMFAQVFRAFMECSSEIQDGIRDMVEIVNDPEATQEEKDAAIGTIAEALFPHHRNGHLGVDLEDLEQEVTAEGRVCSDAMDKQEAHFSDRVATLLSERKMTQGDLAVAIGVGQPAISMLLSRSNRPQRRTVEKIAAALKVAPEEIWLS